jgi:hypothetical protein
MAKDKNWDLICPEDCEGCPKEKKKEQKKILKIIDKWAKKRGIQDSMPVKDLKQEIKELK